MCKIAAGVVYYKPKDAKRFEESLRSVLEQHDCVYIYDNDEEKAYYPVNPKIKVLREGKNMGIAHALNQIMAAADKDGFRWVTTMDQDSILPSGIIEDYLKYIDKCEDDVAIICPQVVDQRRIYMQAKQENSVESIKKCITSGSCTKIDAWKSVGGFDECLFIDLVDDDFCNNVILHGYKIIRLNKWVLNQEFGDIEPKSRRQQKFWLGVSKILHNVNFAKFSYKKNVSPIRVYYTHRNLIYLNRKYKKHGKVGFKNYNCKGYIGFVISFSLPSLLRGKDKAAIFKAILQGTRDGIVLPLK